MTTIDPITDYTNKQRAESHVVHVGHYVYASKDDHATIALSFYPFGFGKHCAMTVLTPDEARKVIEALQAYLNTGARQQRGPNPVTSLPPSPVNPIVVFP